MTVMGTAFLVAATGYLLFLVASLVFLVLGEVDL
jgi:hypothetical protein